MGSIKRAAALLRHEINAYMLGPAGTATYRLYNNALALSLHYALLFLVRTVVTWLSPPPACVQSNFPFPLRDCPVPLLTRSFAS